MLLETQRTDAFAEYHALRHDAAVFDLGTVGLLAIAPAAARTFLRPILPRGIGLLHVGGSASALLLDAEAHPIDLLVVHRLRETYLIETAPGRGPATLAFLAAQPGGEAVRDVRDRYSIVGVEGPYAWRVMREVFGDGASSLPLNGLAERPWQDTTAILSRTGFTGEYGYKVFVPAGYGPALWEALTAVAQPVGVSTVETAMLEVRHPVLHHEVDPGDTVQTCGYNWLVDLDQPTFIGREALLAGEATELTVGVAAPAGTVVAPGAPVSIDGLRIGRVVWSAHSYGLDRVLVLTRLDRAWAASGIPVTLDGSVAATTVSSPYVIPSSWSVRIG